MRQILTKRSLLPLALLGAAAALFVLPPRAAAEAESLAAPAPRPVPVRALRPEAVEGRLEVQRYTGTIQARRESELGFERAGKIARLQVDLGSQVDQGQVLAELDLAPLQLERPRRRADPPSGFGRRRLIIARGDPLNTSDARACLQCSLQRLLTSIDPWIRPRIRPR